MPELIGMRMTLDFQNLSKTKPNGGSCVLMVSAPS